MADLINSFTWSLSVSEDFNECRRKRYWAKYAMWGGWSPTATPLQKTAYRLCKMENRFTLQGNAVERAVMWLIREMQAGRAGTLEQAYEVSAKAYLNQCWSDSKKKLWQSNPKKHCCLHEHYYPAHQHRTEAEMTVSMIDQIKLCIANCISSVLPRLKTVKLEQELPITTMAMGDPESFRLGDVKIYAIPDYAYREGDVVHIHDWKSGQPKDFHAHQMRIYGLWAHVKHQIPAEQIQVHLEYLGPNQVVSSRLTETDLETIRQHIQSSVNDMSEYLVNADIRKNQPLPQDDWELAADPDLCRRCNFYELCKPELES